MSADDARVAPATEPRGPAAPGGVDSPRQSSGGERFGNTVPTRQSAAALRRAVALRTWGGKGSGLPCDFCRVLIASDDVEYEVEAQLDGAVVMLRFHYRCHFSWTGGEEPRVAAERA